MPLFLRAFPLHALQTQKPDSVYLGKNRQEQGQLTWILTEAVLKAHVTIWENQWGGSSGGEVRISRNKTSGLRMESKETRGFRKLGNLFFSGTTWRQNMTDIGNKSKHTIDFTVTHNIHDREHIAHDSFATVVLHHFRIGHHQGLNPLLRAYRALPNPSAALSPFPALSPPVHLLHASLRIWERQTLYNPEIWMTRRVLLYVSHHLD